MEIKQIGYENAADPRKDREGDCSDQLMLNIRFFAVADYVMKHDVSAFRRQLSESATIQLRHFERYESGEPIGASLVVMLSYKSLFDALAANDMRLAQSLASHMGGREKIEKKFDHPFDYAMGYALRAVVLADGEEMRKWPAQFEAVCHKTRSKDFLGYAQVYQALNAHDLDLANEGFQAIVKGHIKQSKGRGVFGNRVDELLCVWGIGLANLCRSRGLRVAAIPPLIPEDLLD